VCRPNLIWDYEPDRILLPIHRALSDGDHGFAKIHVDRVRAKRPEGISEDRYPDHADPQTLEIFGPTDGTLRVRQLAEAVFPPGDRDDALLLDQLE
jgi:hypothetical protein